MGRIAAGAAVLGMAIWGIGALEADGQEVDDRYTLAGNPAVYLLAGEVELVAGSGRDVVVDVEFRGEDAGRLSVDVGGIRGRNALRVRFPSDEIVYDRGRASRYRSQMTVREDGTFGGMSARGGRRVRITGAGEGLEAHAILRVEVPEGRDVAVFVGAGSIVARQVEGSLELDTKSGSIIAEGIGGVVSADTGAGDITLTDVAGSVLADTGAGDIILSGIAGESVEADTGSGDIEGRGVRAERIEFDTGSGSIEVDAIEARVGRVDTGSGSIDLGFVGEVRDLEVDTGSGSVTLRFAQALNAEIEIDTGSGGIDVDLPDVVRTGGDRRSWEGIAGNGRGSITVDTGSGSIRLLRGS
jgi:lia operon protein LiaG